MLNTTEGKPRRTWVAALLSLALPGLGHLYAGRPGRGIFAFSCLVITWPLSLVAMLQLPTAPFNVILPLLAVLGVVVWAVVDAARSGKRQGSAYQLQAFNRWYVYTGVLVLWGFVIQPALSHSIRTALVQAYQVASGSMLPTLRIGDHILVEKYAYGIRSPLTGGQIIPVDAPQRGDVIIYEYPKEKERALLHRIIGMPGETLQIDRRRVLINGTPLGEPYAVFSDSPFSRLRDQIGPILIPAGHTFVMGDNRDHSMDSRVWGFLPVGDILGRVRRIYFSWDREAGTPRWDRIGQTIE